WYPLIINNRAVHKPFIDHVRFGYFLGYPDCCQDFFRRYNDHFRYSHLFEAFKHTKAAPLTLCNPLLKNHTYSYIFHMPCSYDCERTARYAADVRRALKRHEPNLAERIDELLARPFLVIEEHDAYIFEGRLRGREIRYRDFAFVGASEQRGGELTPALARGDRVRAEADTVSIYKGARTVAKKRYRFEPFVIQCRGRR
ncbi:MAG: hypothetical protein PHT59_06130, partial [Candidatus Omnitrophica bacterium]|nr:hypothetical protein [Candidatus Omnitrophota bacterium]